MFHVDISEGMFYALPVVISIGATVWAVVSGEPWWSIAVAPAVAFVVGMSASLILVIVAVVLQDYVPFWRRSFWRRSR